jgi:hypothetical protein
MCRNYKTHTKAEVRWDKCKLKTLFFFRHSNELSCTDLCRLHSNLETPDKLANDVKLFSKHLQDSGIVFSSFIAFPLNIIFCQFGVIYHLHTLLSFQSGWLSYLPAWNTLSHYRELHPSEVFFWYQCHVQNLFLFQYHFYFIHSPGVLILSHYFKLPVNVLDQPSRLNLKYYFLLVFLQV